jgi:hypothetical protein
LFEYRTNSKGIGGVPAKHPRHPLVGTRAYCSASYHYRFYEMQMTFRSVVRAPRCKT